MIFKVANLQAQLTSLTELQSSNSCANQQYAQNQLVVEANPNPIPVLDPQLIQEQASSS